MDTQPNPLLAYSMQVPRYTSYPTAPHFRAMEEAVHRRWMAAVPATQPVSLYVHVPYCRKLCWFCGCHTRITKRYDPVARFLPVLAREMQLVSAALGRRQAVQHVHFGGGSPSMLEAVDFSAMMQDMRTHFDLLPNAEIAIELDPRGMTEGRIASYAKAGVNRLSIGVQDFSPQVQDAINRQQPFRTVYDTVQLSRDYGIDRINMDLVYGLPRQTLASLGETIAEVLLLAPARIALFGYAHVPWKKKNMRLIDEATLPDAALRAAMFAHASEQLLQAGYVAIGLDHFAHPADSMAMAAREGALHRNFQGYTTDKSPTLIGLGPSSIGAFEAGYVQNKPGIEAWMQAVDAGQLPTGNGIALTDDDRLRRGIIEQLMCCFEVDVAAHCMAIGQPRAALADAFARLDPLVRDGLVTVEGDHIRVSAAYPQAVRLVCAAFDRYLDPQSRQHSQVS